MNTLWKIGYWDGFMGTVDIIADYTVTFFLDEKSWPMFSFLFGLGLSIQMQRAESRGSRFITVYSRRLVILLLIGAAHYIFTERDILYGYAITGFYLLLVRKLNLKLLIGLALISFTYAKYAEVNRYYKSQKKNAIIARDIASVNSARKEIYVDSTILDSYVGVYEGPERTMFVMRDKNDLFVQPNGNRRPGPLVAESATKFSLKTNSNFKISFIKDSSGIVNALLATPTGILYRKIQSGQPVIDGATLRKAANRGKVARTYATGSFGEIVSMRARDFWKNYSSWTKYLPNWGGFPIFLLGLYAGRRRIFDSVSNNRKFIKKVMCWGLIFGLTVQTIAYVWEFWLRDNSNFLIWPETFLRLMWRLGQPALALGYLAALTLLLQRGVWKKMLAPLASVGQMALTNYLLQSVAFVLLFFGYGLGWFGQTSAFIGLLLALLLFALQIVFSRWWLRHFRFGPFEWLWRSATYWKFQPMSLKKEKKEILSS